MRIFIASTFEDLREYREAAIRGLRQLGHDIVAMEDFTATSAPPIQVVLQRVAECEAYLGLFAWKYGYVPQKGDALPAGTVLPARATAGETSITHMEYLWAKELNKPILAFLLEETEPWPPHKIDAFAVGSAEQLPPGATPHTPGAAIQELRRQLQQERIVAFFTTPADLEARVTTAVTNLGMSIGVKTNLVHLTQPVSPVADSSIYGEIRFEIQRASESGQRMSTINIGTQWWSTRLYLLAVLAREFTNIVRIVVVDGEEFVGMLSVSTVINRLESTNLKLARFETKIRGTRIRATDQVMALDTAEAEWTKLLPLVEEERQKILVTRPNLAMWFSDAMLGDAIEVDELARATLLDLVRILGYPNDFVPVRVQPVSPAEPVPEPDPDGRRWEQAPITVIDKRALNHKLAQQYLRELMDRARLR